MITILLATYNGEKYLRQQLDSLLRQTYQDFMIWAQDDLSTDSTWDILNEYHERFPDKIWLSQTEKNTGSAKANFIDMMLKARDEYLMLCDQDDIWLPDKIELTLAEMKNAEIQNPGKPVLVHTDLSIVDQDLNILEYSFKESTKRDYNRKEYRHMVTVNNASGCTIMYNHALAEYLYDAPNYTMMHDWWLKLIAASFGVVAHVDTQTMLYRQHGDNSLGAKKVRTLSYKLERLKNWRKLRQDLHDTCQQAASLLACYSNKLSNEQIEFLQAYSGIPYMNKLDKWRTIFRLRVFMYGISRNIAFFMFI